MDKFSYGLGMGIGQNLASMGVSSLEFADFVQGMKDVLANASAGNLASARVIEKNGGIFLEAEEGSRYYRIEL